MSTITFYQKPGCATNARQRRLLESADHEVLVRDLLTEPWTAHALMAFFGDTPVAGWINRAAPRVKSGQIVPEQLTAEQALALLLAEPLLIRRPLMQIGAVRFVGFDPARLKTCITLPEERAAAPEVQACAHDLNHGHSTSATD